MERQIGKGEFFQEELTSLNKTGWRWGLVRKRKISRMNSGYLPSRSRLIQKENPGDQQTLRWKINKYKRTHTMITSVLLRPLTC